VLAGGLPPGALHAGARRFVYSYEATTSSPGEVEFETWVTWKRSDNSAARKDVFDFRHEFEFGVTDRLQLAVYVADWRYQTALGDEDGFSYQHSAVEAIYNLTSPVRDLLGSAVYGEIKVGDKNAELEGKLILQKNLGPLVLVYNVTLEAEWEGDSLRRLDERSGEFQQSAGISYELSPRFSVGVELLHEVGFPDWSTAEDSKVFIGPNASVRLGRVFATVAPLFQVTDHRDEPDVQTRLIVGIEF
jgi:hypothetical protein